MEPADAVLEALVRANPPALFITELAAKLPRDSAVVETVTALAARGAVLVSDPPPPDPHLADLDRRIVALVPPDGDLAPALHATDLVWGRWVRAFLAAHRCQ